MRGEQFVINWEQLRLEQVPEEGGTENRTIFNWKRTVLCLC